MVEIEQSSNFAISQSLIPIIDLRTAAVVLFDEVRIEGNITIYRIAMQGLDHVASRIVNATHDVV